MVAIAEVPDTSALEDVVTTLASWQRDTALVQLHPGDLGWAWRSGASAVAAALRIWTDRGDIVAIGFLDGPTVFRMTVAPERWSDDEVARRVLDDLSDVGGPVSADDALSVEVPTTTRLHARLASSGWSAGEAWAPLARDLSGPIDSAADVLRTEVVDADGLGDFTAVHRSAWGSDRFTDDRWRTMTGGIAFQDGVSLLGRNADGSAVAGVTVWSAGAGRPGLIEPMGVHAGHRGRGHGRAICVAAAAALQERGASTAWVCTPASLRSAVATYRSAGFVPLPERLDRVRSG